MTCSICRREGHKRTAHYPKCSECGKTAFVYRFSEPPGRNYKCKEHA